MNFSSDSIKQKQKMLSSHRIKMGTKALVYTFKFIVILFVFGAISVG